MPLVPQRMDLMLNGTAKSGGVYLYANQRGCDGGRLYFDGCASVVANGRLLAQGAQFGLQEVEVVTAAVDLDEVVSYRGAGAPRWVHGMTVCGAGCCHSVRVKLCHCC